MSRKEAREIIFKLIYERCITGESNKLSFNIYTQNFDGDDLGYAKKVYLGTGQKSKFLNAVVERYSKDFKIERVYKVDLAALLLASYEILFLSEIPYQVAANEAVELSKKYSTEKSYKFVNGILSSIIRDKEKLLVESAAESAEGDFGGIEGEVENEDEFEIGIIGIEGDIKDRIEDRVESGGEDGNKESDLNDLS